MCENLKVFSVSNNLRISWDFHDSLHPEKSTGFAPCANSIQVQSCLHSKLWLIRKVLKANPATHIKKALLRTKDRSVKESLPRELEWLISKRFMRGPDTLPSPPQSTSTSMNLLAKECGKSKQRIRPICNVIVNNKAACDVKPVCLITSVTVSLVGPQGACSLPFTTASQISYRL